MLDTSEKRIKQLVTDAYNNIELALSGAHLHKKSDEIHTAVERLIVDVEHLKLAVKGRVGISDEFQVKTRIIIDREIYVNARGWEHAIKKAKIQAWDNFLIEARGSAPDYDLVERKITVMEVERKIEILEVG